MFPGGEQGRNPGDFARLVGPQHGYEWSSPAPPNVNGNIPHGLHPTVPPSLYPGFPMHGFPPMMRQMSPPPGLAGSVIPHGGPGGPSNGPPPGFFPDPAGAKTNAVQDMFGLMASQQNLLQLPVVQKDRL